MACCDIASDGGFCTCAFDNPFFDEKPVVVDSDEIGGPEADVVHGGKDNWCVNSERLAKFDFDCIYCNRRCCWCFGSGCDRDSQQPEGKGICCDCAGGRCSCVQCEELRAGL